MDRLILSHGAYTELLRADPAPPVGSQNPWSAFMGMRIETSPLYPIQQACGKCGGTGEGTDSTYCPACKGAGEIRTVGMMLGRGPITMLTTPLPRKFDPRATFQVAPRRLCRGLA